MDKAIHSVQLGGMGISHFHPANKRLIISIVRGSCSQVSYRLASYVPKNAWLQSSLLRKVVARVICVEFQASSQQLNLKIISGQLVVYNRVSLITTPKALKCTSPQFFHVDTFLAGILIVLATILTSLFLIQIFFLKKRSVICLQTNSLF